MDRLQLLRLAIALPCALLLGLTPAAGKDRGLLTQAEGGGVIDIPGIGPIPIPLPPGSHVFGPRGPAPQSGDAQPPEPETKARHSAPLSLDDLFFKLTQAEDADEAGGIAKLIGRIWSRSGSDTADLLADRAKLAEELDQRGLARELLDRVVALEPRWAEALVRRSRLRAALGDAPGAISDLQEAVRLEPRRFDAYASLGALEEARGEKKSALEAYRRSLEIDPRADDIIKAEERLRIEVEGRDI
jgi:tetratricopeptide (TPR) repeat protein